MYTPQWWSVSDNRGVLSLIFQASYPRAWLWHGGNVIGAWAQSEFPGQEAVKVRLACTLDLIVSLARFHKERPCTHPSPILLFSTHVRNNASWHGITESQFQPFPLPPFQKAF
ncbi:predicted protein [Histoplasma capsulatum G186AR]|uniref:Uncharacterized protein n=1 Tax=Ajellomyces capsulatus (strain G186AR / H82 / ATCC MYA-2454 / RMSCC 2432) TaxID=447093 RepID=C0NPV8_AJECG|nr:uncharacterized protein HCBG_05188 [Histoplasma capsulatum G186AR]EEH06968.1 predicted protein [Histoplasma capsulatum G186AR]